MKIKNISSLFKIGAWYSISQITNQLGNQIDVMTIGKFLDEIAVGLYSYAYTISIGIPITINSIISSVMFPAFSIIQGNVKQLKKIYLISTKMLSILSFPLMISIFFTIEPVVLLFMGQKWEKLISLVQILCIAGLSTGVGGPLWGAILKAIGKTKTFFFLTCLRMVSILFFVFTGAYWGVNGVAWSISIYSIIFRFIYQSIINKYINMNMGEYLRAILIGFLPSIPMVLWMIIINNLITFGNIIYIFFFIICLIIGLIIYMYSFRILHPEDFLLLIDYLSQVSLLNNFTKRIKKLFNV